MTSIHPSALVDPQAEVGSNVIIGAFCVVERGTTIGDRCTLASHVVVREGTRIDCDNQIYEGAVIGGRPQHLMAGPTVGGVRIGRGNTIREHVTIHSALEAGEDTMVGDHNLMMVNAHIAHDCVIGNHTILVNNVMLAGHVQVEDRANLSGGVGVHQFCRIGRLAMVHGLGRVTQDVPPYVKVDGMTRHVAGLNTIGLRRNGFSRFDIEQLKAAYRLIFRSGLRWAEILDALATQFPHGPAAEFREFFLRGRRGFLRERPATERQTVRLMPPPSDDDEHRHLGRAA